MGWWATAARRHAVNLCLASLLPGLLLAAEVGSVGGDRASPAAKGAIATPITNPDSLARQAAQVQRTDRSAAVSPPVAETAAWAVPYGYEFWHDRVQCPLPEVAGETAQVRFAPKFSLQRAVERRTQALQVQDDTVRGGSAAFALHLDGDTLSLTPPGGSGGASPATESEAARTLALRVRTEAIRRGRHVLYAADDTGRTAAWQVAGNTAQCRLGSAGLVQHLESRPEGVELCWVIRQPPVGVGSLNIVMAVSGLPYGKQTPEGLEYGEPGSAARVRIGQATAVDSAGQRWPLTMQAEGEAVCIDVPESVLATACYPLAVDPLLAPQFVKDINAVPATAGSAPARVVAVGSTLYFTATDRTSGTELWKTDGTEAGTVRVKDIYPGVTGSTPALLVALGTVLLFAAADPVHGRELWRTDGTEAGTVLVKDIFPGVSPLGPTNESSPTYLTAMGATVYFSAAHGTTNAGLWKTDGTAAGTVLVKETGTPARKPTYLIPMGSLLLFVGNDSANGKEIWRSDGTTAGTACIKDIYSGTTGSDPSELTVAGTVLFFRATEGTGGRELWKSDGTTGGTIRVKDIYAGSSDSYPNNLKALGTTVYFAATDGTSGYELWKSDGTATGTVRVRDIYSGGSSGWPNNLATVGSTLYFAATEGGGGTELWKSDGSDAGTVRIKDINAGSASSQPASLTALGTTLFFQANDGGSGVELWASDGTEAGTVRVKDIYGGSGNSSPANLRAVGSTLYFQASDGLNGSQLWRSDGSEAGTTRVTDISSSTTDSSLANLTAVGDTLFFTADDGSHGVEVWKSDGTDAGTVCVKDIYVGSGTSSPASLAAMGSTLYFQANDGILNAELWKSDGTEAGTVLVKDIYAGASASYPARLTAVGSTLFFMAQDSTTDYELWKSDGTEAGTVLVKDIQPGTASSGPNYLTAMGSTLFFQATGGTSLRELWKSDGTEAGTAVVKDIGGTGYGEAEKLTAVGSTLFLRASNASYGRELWKSDGTEAGTVLVKDIVSGTSSSGPDNLTAAGALVFFSTVGNAGDGLWRSDGTADGTFCVKAARIVRLVAVGETLFFACNDDTIGTELWKSDGTVAGTVLVKDIWSGSASSIPEYLTAVGSVLLFQANDGLGGEEVWQSDGTAAGTVQAVDIIPGSPGSLPGPFAVAGNRIFFPGTDDEHGQELWCLTPTYTLTTPGNPGAQDIHPDRITWTWQDSTDYEAGYLVWSDAGSAQPVTLRTTAAANASTWTQAGLAVNTLYSAQMAAVDLYGFRSSRTPAVSRYTRASPPLAPVLSVPLPHTNLAIRTAPGDGNPANTLYAIQVTWPPAGSAWVQADGSLGAAPVYRAATEWGTTVLAGLADQVLYGFTVVACNGDGVESTGSASASSFTPTTRFHVDSARPDDSGDGFSWEMAKRTVQAAIDACTGPYQQVWVKAGTYSEARPAADGSLTLKSGVKLYGGFVGDETDLAARDLAANVTTLDGTTSRAGLTAYHVASLIGISDARLDGFTITGGVADGTVEADLKGGGVYCSSLGDGNAIAHCALVGNSASYGGGVYGAASQVRMEDCQVLDNTGSGVYLFDATLTASHCVIVGNEPLGVLATASALAMSSCSVVGNAMGGVYCSAGTAALTDSVIADNRFTAYGGGLSFVGTVDPSLTNCQINGNRASIGGGGIYCASSSPTLVNCVISQNEVTGTGNGGGLYCLSSSPTLLQCTLSGNLAAAHGGGLYCSDSSPELTNSVFAESSGTALYEATAAADPQVTHCLFAGSVNGADYHDHDTGATYAVGQFGDIVPAGKVTNCLAGDPRFVMDSPIGVRGTWTGDAAYNASTRQTALTAAGGTFTAGALAGRLLNPDRTEAANQRRQALVVSNTGAEVVVWGDHSYASAGDAFRLVDYRLWAGSAAIDQGTAAGAPAADIDGNPRPVDTPDLVGVSTYDIGAYEAQLVPPLPPASTGVTALGADTITWTWVGGSSNETGFRVWRDAGSAAPTTLRVTTAAGATSWADGPLTPNTQYAMQVAATNPAGDSAKTAAITAWTLAATPLAPTVGSPGATTLAVALDSGDANPPGTGYAIWCATTSEWVQTDGSCAAAAAWQTAATWGTTTVTGLLVGTTYAFQAKARNGDGVDTALGPAAAGTTISVLSATPGTPDLLPVSDTGASDTDNLTRLNNGSAGTRLSFDVGGTVAGATVRVYAEGTPIGNAVAGGAMTTVPTDGVTPLAEGAHAITATQTEPGKDESPASPALTVTLDTTAPVLQSAASRKTHGSAGTFDLVLPIASPWGVECRMVTVSTLSLVFGFSEAVHEGAGFAATVTSGTATPGASELSSNTLTLALTGVADGQWLALRLNPIEDPAGNALDLAYTLGILAGDVTLNGTVNAQDILFVRYSSLQPLDQATNFRYDINASGATNAQDVLFVRYCSLHALPAP